MAVFNLLDQNGERTEIKNLDILVYDSRGPSKGIRILRKDEKGIEHRLFFAQSSSFSGKTDSLWDIYRIDASHGPLRLLESLVGLMTLGNLDLSYEGIEHFDFREGFQFRKDQKKDVEIITDPMEIIKRAG
jgi:hypothetical protein